MNQVPVLDHFAYCPRCSSPDIERRSDIMVNCPRCDFTLYFNPTSSAAVIIEDAQGRVIAIRRAKDPRRGTLGLPGGFLDLNETLEEAAIRETKEEVNLSLETITFLGAWPNHYTHKGVTYPVNDTYFTSRVDSFENLKLETEEVQSVEFVDPKAVPEEDWAFPSLRNAIRKYLEK